MGWSCGIPGDGVKEIGFWTYGAGKGKDRRCNRRFNSSKSGEREGDSHLDFGLCVDDVRNRGDYGSSCPWWKRLGVCQEIRAADYWSSSWKPGGGWRSGIYGCGRRNPRQFGFPGRFACGGRKEKNYRIFSGKRNWGKKDELQIEGLGIFQTTLLGRTDSDCGMRKMWVCSAGRERIAVGTAGGRELYAYG